MYSPAHHNHSQHNRWGTSSAPPSVIVHRTPGGREDQGREGGDLFKSQKNNQHQSPSALASLESQEWGAKRAGTRGTKQEGKGQGSPDVGKSGGFLPAT